MWSVTSLCSLLCASRCIARACTRVFHGVRACVLAGRPHTSIICITRIQSDPTFMTRLLGVVGAPPDGCAGLACFRPTRLPRSRGGVSPSASLRCLTCSSWALSVWAARTLRRWALLRPGRGLHCPADPRRATRIEVSRASSAKFL